mmetsp:Transcript_18347/g.27253  ORF Transcript_18347/g.27253 Transcript_18347/m.27253 type:complete len:176 (+) Transcript_18347:960-1487(+)
MRAIFMCGTSRRRRSTRDLILFLTCPKQGYIDPVVSNEKQISTSLERVASGTEASAFAARTSSSGSLRSLPSSTSFFLNGIAHRYPASSSASSGVHKSGPQNRSGNRVTRRARTPRGKGHRVDVGLRKPGSMQERDTLSGLEVAPMTSTGPVHAVFSTPSRKVRGWLPPRSVKPM